VIRHFNYYILDSIEQRGSGLWRFG
jgi:hypothetical protein